MAQAVRTSIPVFSAPNPLQGHASGLQGEIKRMVDLESFSSEAAVVQAQSLRSIAERFREQILASESLASMLEGREIPFPLAHRMMQLLTMDQLQCYDSLKKELSKTTLIFFEFTVFQCGFEDRRIYKETIDKLRADISKVIDTVPECEVETRFNLLCIQAAIQKLNVGIGKWKQVAKDQAKPVLIGLARALLTLDRPGPSTAVAFIEPVANLIVAIYQNMEKRWYGNVWALRWHCSGNKITTFEQLESIRPLIKGCDQKYQHAFYVSQLFSEIINNPQSTNELKKAVFEEGEVCLLKLVELQKDARVLKKAFWQVRYITLVNLGKIAENTDPNNHPYRLKCITAILGRWMTERTPVKVLAGTLTARLAPLNHNEWLQIFSTLQQEVEKVSPQTQLMEIQTQKQRLEKLQHEQDLLQAELDGLQEGPYEQSTQSIEEEGILGRLEELEKGQGRRKQEIDKLQQKEEEMQQALCFTEIKVEDQNDWSNFN